VVQPGLVDDLQWWLGSFDTTFIEWRRVGGPADRTRAALSWFWDRSEFRIIREALALPHFDWAEIVDCLLALGSGSSHEWTRELWVEVANASERLAERDAAAAAIVALYAFAAWEGALGEDLLNDPPDDGWYIFPLHVGRNLFAADAVWTSQFIVNRANEFLEYASIRLSGQHIRARSIPYTELAAHVARRIDEYVADLAWDLQVACGPEIPNFRAELAAMFWTLGDVPRAELLKDTREPVYKPSLQTLKELVAVSISRIPMDPFLQYIWLELKDRQPIDLRQHSALFALINNFYEGSSPVSLFEVWGGSLSKAYARILIASMRGPVADEDRVKLREAWSLFYEIIADRDPLSEFRLAGLCNLVLTDDAQQRTLIWHDLTRVASRLLATLTAESDFTPYHCCLMLPFYYLEDQSLESEVSAANALEHHRSGGLLYHLALVPPRVRTANEPMWNLLGEEATLLYALRGSHFVRLIPHLPRHYQVIETWGLPGSREEERPDNLLNDETAKQALRDTWTQLSDLWARMFEVEPDYAHRRKYPYADVEAFTEALTTDEISLDPSIAPTPP